MKPRHARPCSGRCRCLFGAGVLAQPAAPPTRQVPPASPNAAANVRFADVTRESGWPGSSTCRAAPRRTTSSRPPDRAWRCWDFDGDGWLDIYLVNGSTLEPRPGGRAARRALSQQRRSHVPRRDRRGRRRQRAMGSGRLRRRRRQRRRAGSLRHQLRSQPAVPEPGRRPIHRCRVAAGVAVDSWSTGCAFGDYDGDGWLDLYVAGYVAFDVKNPPPVSADVPGSGGWRGGAPQRRAARDGRGVLRRRGVLHLSRRAGDVRPARAARRAGSPVPQQPRRHVHRDDARGGRDRRQSVSMVSASPGSIWTTTGGSICWWPTTQGRTTSIATPARAGSRTSATRPARRSTATAASRRTWASPSATTTTTAATTSTSPISPTTSTCSITTTTARTFTDVSFRSGVAQVSIPFLGWGTDFLDYDNDGWLRSARRQRPRLSRGGLDALEHLLRAARAAVPESRRPPFRGSWRGGGRGADDARACRADRRSATSTTTAGSTSSINNIDGAPTLARNNGGGSAGHWLTVRLRRRSAAEVPARRDRLRRIRHRRRHAAARRSRQRSWPDVAVGSARALRARQADGGLEARSSMGERCECRSTRSIASMRSSRSIRGAAGSHTGVKRVAMADRRAPRR